MNVALKQPEYELESCDCPLCGSPEATNSPYEQAPFRVVRCTDCSMWYLNPRLTPDATNALYEDDTYFEGGESGYTDYSSQEKSLRRTFRRLIGNFAKRDLTGGDFLDVGAGLGFMLDEARDHFASRTGVELSPAAARKASALSGAVIAPSIEALGSEPRFDLIVAAHVIEHIPTPLDFTKQLLSILRPGGTLVLAAPDMGSFWRTTMGKRWPSFKYPEHVSFFDAVTLKKLMVDAGGVNAERMPYVHDFPLNECINKTGLPAPKIAGKVNVPLPSTTICYIVRKG